MEVIKALILVCVLAGERRLPCTLPAAGSPPCDPVFWGEAEPGFDFLFRDGMRQRLTPMTFRATQRHRPLLAVGEQQRPRMKPGKCTEPGNFILK